MEETNNCNFKFKLKLPKLDLQKNNTNKVVLINSSAPKNQEEEEIEEGEIKEVEEESDSPPPPPIPANDDGGTADGEVKLHICPYCNKSFTSGKALGGHKSSHVKKVSKIVVDSGLNPIEDEGEGEEDEEKVFECFLCPKRFRSNKSLHGHMRSHPERVYRGMKPPRQMDFHVESDDVVEERLRRLGTWRVTGKRGRNGCMSWRSTSPFMTSTLSASLEYDPEAVEAAETLLLLARGREVGQGFGGGDVERDVKRAKKGKGLMTPSKDGNFDDNGICYLKNSGVLPNYSNHFDNGDEIRVHEELIRVTPIEKVGNINQINGVNLGSKDESNKKWVCGTCGKSFPTHQALGGHRSSHNKDKHNNPNTIMVQTRVIDGSGLTDNGGGGSGQVEVAMVNTDTSPENVIALGPGVIGQHNYKGKICHRTTFTSGQALGGHQRCHYVPSSDNSSSPGQSSCQTGRRGNMNMFDLNVEPPMIDEDNNNGDVSLDSIS